MGGGNGGRAIEATVEIKCVQYLVMNLVANIDIKCKFGMI